MARVQQTNPSSVSQQGAFPGSFPEGAQHAPPWQARSGAQSDCVVQAAPAVLTHTGGPPLAEPQWSEQQSPAPASSSQRVPSCAHPHEPPTHEFEQHSASFVHAAFKPLHAQAPNRHVPVQQSVSSTHSALRLAQPHCWPFGAALEQQTWAPPIASTEAPAPAHVHTPSWQRFEQQSPFLMHESPLLP
jgi:hypothetical protein